MTVREIISDGTYTGIHKWLRDNYRKPSFCELCQQRKSRIEWANVTGVYEKARINYRAICVSCHRRMDKGNREFCSFSTWKDKCFRDHEMTVDNIYIRQDLSKSCRACRKISHAKSNAISNPKQRKGWKP